MSAKLVKRALPLAALLAISSCLPSGVVTGSKPLPTASATLQWATIDMPRGSYCWNSGGHGECADSAGIDDLLATGYLKLHRTAGGFDVKITFHSATQPTSSNIELIRSPDSKATSVAGSLAGSFSLEASPPAAAGTYVYVVTGTWPEGDVGFYLAIDLIPGVA